VKSFKTAVGSFLHRISLGRHGPAGDRYHGVRLDALLAVSYHSGMSTADYQMRQALRQLDSDRLSQHQLSRLNALLAAILPHNRFYQMRLSDQGSRLKSLDQLDQFPFTFKDDLLGDSGDGRYAANLTWEIDRYVRMHRTSGTRGRPMIVLDTPADWQWWINCWQYVLDAGDISETDRVLMAFSFGPFIGFWSAHDAVVHRGALVAPAGGMSTIARIDLIRSIAATTVFCTPSYAMHMAEVAEENQTNIVDLPVRKFVVAGEPGGSIPAVRDRIEEAWQARVVDHAGASEVGAWGFADPDGAGLYINEAEFIAEFLSVDSGAPAGEGELSELVLTTLGRTGSPVIRYRTGDLVRPIRDHDGECRFVFLRGGVVGRVDDMLIIRGVNIFPSSIEQILRSFPEIVEFRMVAFRQGEMDSLRIEIEDRLERPERVARELEVRLGLKVHVDLVPIGSLPRFELKGQRFIDNRRNGA
jgi:phenylacetate-CoA ligase